MAHAGDTYTITLMESHLDWGSYRHTDSRGFVYGEGYIPIPADVAYEFHLLNRNGTKKKDIWGLNLFNCISADGEFSGVLRSQGNQSDPNYGKQFAGDKNLKALGDWFYAIGASVGDEIKVTWTSDTDIIIEKL